MQQPFQPPPGAPMAPPRGARSSARRSGWGPIFALVFLSLMLMVGYVFMYLALDARIVALRTLQNTIETDLEQKLKAEGVALPVQSTPGPSLIRYDDKFFKEVYALCDKGIKYEALSGKVGYPADAAIASVDTLLQSSSPPAPSLQAMVSTLQNQVGALQQSLDQTKVQLADAINRRDTYQKEKEAAEAALRATRDDLLNKMAKDVGDQKKQVQEYKDLYDKAEARRRQADQAVDQLQKRVEAVRADMDKTVKTKQDRIKELEDIIRAPKVQKVAGPVATTLRTDPALGFVILNRGSRDGIANGEQFYAYRLDRGKLYMTGKVVVVNADELVSRADVMQQRKLNPITSGDVLYKASEPPPAEEVVTASTDISEGEPAAKTGAGAGSAYGERHRASYIRLK